MTTAVSVLDPEMLDTLRGLGDATFLAEVLELYTSDAEPRIRKMRTAIALRDAAMVASEAHALKSSSGSIGASAVRDRCADLETAGRERALEGAKETLAALEREYGRAVSELRKIVEV